MVSLSGDVMVAAMAWGAAVTISSRVMMSDKEALQSTLALVDLCGDALKE
ncbi:MAG: hypothetical protein Q9M13_08440 [Mariprofundales bacterium]|nr:hypothetical protein [Mariprofundales bacterium]